MHEEAAVRVANLAFNFWAAWPLESLKPPAFPVAVVAAGGAATTVVAAGGVSTTEDAAGGGGVTPPFLPGALGLVVIVTNC